MPYFISLAGAFLCYLVARVYPGTDVAAVFTVVCMMFVTFMALVDIYALLSAILFIFGARLGENRIHRMLMQVHAPNLLIFFIFVIDGATFSTAVWWLLKLWDMV